MSSRMVLEVNGNRQGTRPGRQIFCIVGTLERFRLSRQRVRQLSVDDAGIATPAPRPLIDPETRRPGGALRYDRRRRPCGR